MFITESKKINNSLVVMVKLDGDEIEDDNKEYFVNWDFVEENNDGYKYFEDRCDANDFFDKKVKEMEKKYNG